MCGLFLLKFFYLGGYLSCLLFNGLQQALKDPWPRVLSLPGQFVGDPASLACDNIFNLSVISKCVGGNIDYFLRLGIQDPFKLHITLLTELIVDVLSRRFQGPLLCFRGALTRSQRSHAPHTHRENFDFITFSQTPVLRQIFMK